MKRFIALVILFFVYTGIPAQEKAPDFGWKTSAIGKVNVTQSQFDNWSQGGENTLAWQGLFEATVTNEQEHFLWKNYLKMSYGQNKIGSGSLKKTTDEIVLESVLNYKTGWTADAYLALTAKTQFSAGYQYPADAPAVEISNFLDPGYFTQEVGLSWNPTKQFSARMGAAFKETVADRFASRYSDDPATPSLEKMRAEPGGSASFLFNGNIHPNIFLKSRLDMFANFQGIQSVDVDWDNTFSSQITKFISVDLNIRIFYDRDISPKRQLKQTLGLGITYTFL